LTRINKKIILLVIVIGIGTGNIFLFFCLNFWLQWW